MSARTWLLAAALFAAPCAWAGTVTQTNLVSDGAISAKFTDPNLKNAWGISYSPTGPFWVSDNATGLTTVYKTDGSVQSLVVTVPSANGTDTGTPTGQIFNGTTGFVVSQGGKSGAALFIFATEDGTISGWAPSVNGGSAVVAVNRAAQGASYKGIALYTDQSGKNYLLATDFHGGTIDVFDASYNLVSSFRDTKLPKAYSPYNVAVLNGNIYVAYARVDKARHDSLPGKGFGIIEEIKSTGEVEASFKHGTLNGPWGMAIAPKSFGSLSGDLLVGNFGNGTISVFTNSLSPMGVLKNAKGKKLVIDGLWGLIPGNGGSGGDASAIYFSAGPNDEANGLFGSLTYNP